MKGANQLLAFAAIAEVATGVGLMAVPSLVGRLLFGAELAGVAVPVARVLGLALIALGIACWPGRTALGSMLTYNLLATAYLAWLGVRGEWVGHLLWPAVVLHAVMTIILALVWLAIQTARGEGNHASLQKE